MRNKKYVRYQNAEEKAQQEIIKKAIENGEKLDPLTLMTLGFANLQQQSDKEEE